MRLSELKDKKILILGFGREGKDSYLALKKMFPGKKIGIADEKKNGKDYLKAVRNYDVIIKTPGIPGRIVKPFLKKGIKMTSQTEIFFDNFKGTIIGVTGTKGKGTTCSLIYQILKKAGLKAHLVGNIGKPVFQYLLKGKGEDIFVYELSSHQLQNLKKSPHIAVFLNLFPDHLDYYKNFNAYQKAKENIALYQTQNDFFIYNRDDKIVKEIAKTTKAQKLSFNCCLIRRIKQQDIPLRGEFNLQNIKAAIVVGKILGVSERDIARAIKNFKPLPHRLEFVGRHKGIDFYNDSMSTIPEVTMAALDALGSKVKTLILGGSEKGSDYAELAQKIAQSKIRTLIIFPGTGEKVWQEILALKKTNLPQPFFVDSMSEAVMIAYQQTSRPARNASRSDAGGGEVCLLSPGAASFNLFRDYKERGNLFKRHIRQYAKKR